MKPALNWLKGSHLHYRHPVQQSKCIDIKGRHSHNLQYGKGLFPLDFEHYSCHYWQTQCCYQP